VSRRRHPRADLDSPVWWLYVAVVLCFGALIVAFYLAVAVVWLVWAMGALTVSAIAKLGHNDALAQSAVRSLAWKVPGIAGKSSRSPSRRR
jgi:hypothetical protein